MLMCCCGDTGECCANRYGYCDDGSTGGGPLDVLYLTAVWKKEFQTFNGADIGSYITHTGTLRRVSTLYYPECSGGSHPGGGDTACLWLSDETFNVRSGDWRIGRCPGSELGAVCMDHMLYPVRMFFLTSANAITSFTNDDGCSYTDYGYGEVGECYVGYFRPQCDATNCREVIVTGDDQGKIMINQSKLQFVSCNPLYAIGTKACATWNCGSAYHYGRDDYVSYVLSE